MEQFERVRKPVPSFRNSHVAMQAYAYKERHGVKLDPGEQ